MTHAKRLPLRMPDDTVPFANAHLVLESLGVRYERPSLHQLKIGCINYYPNSGTIHVDGEKRARPGRGKEALKALLLDQRARLGVYVARRNAAAAKRDAEEANK